MSYFPMFVDLEGKHVLAVGAGTIGSRRILTLLNSEPGDSGGSGRPEAERDGRMERIVLDPGTV